MGLFYRSVKMKLIGVLLLFIIPLISAQAKADDNKAKGYPVRTPKLFYVYTERITSTVNALTTCFVSTSTAATACSTGRKKRHLDFDLEELDIKPSALRKDNEYLDEEFFDKDDTSVGELESTMELDHVKEEMNRIKGVAVLVDDHHHLYQVLLHPDLLRGLSGLHPHQLDHIRILITMFVIITNQ